MICDVIFFEIIFVGLFNKFEEGMLNIVGVIGLGEVVDFLVFIDWV